MTSRTLFQPPIWSNLFAFLLPLAVFVVLYLICASALPDVAKTAEGAVQNLKSSAAAAGSDLSAAAGDLVETARQAVSEMKRIAADIATRTGDRAGEAAGVLADDARAIGRDGGDALVETVARRPVASLAVAAGIGLVLGWATRSGAGR